MIIFRIFTLINSKEEESNKVELEPFLMISMAEDEIITEYVHANQETPKVMVEVPSVNAEPEQKEVLPLLPPSNFVFQKKYLQFFLVVSGFVSGLLLAYDLKNQQTVEPRGILSGLNIFASVLGLSYFAKQHHKKEKVDEEIKTTSLTR